MSNKLKDIFSNDPPGFNSKLRFKDSEAYQHFCSAVSTVHQDGCCVDIEGVDSISTYMQLQGIQIPIEQDTNITKFMIGPSKEKVSFTVVWDNKEKIYNFYRYFINDGVILETEDSKKVTIKYQMQFQYAKTTEEIVFETNACIAFLTKLCDPSKQIGTSEDISTTKDFIENLKRTAMFFSHLSDLQKALNLTFAIKEVVSMSTDDQQDIEELYLLLCKKVPLRLNKKINSTESLDINAPDIQAEPIIGTKLFLVFSKESDYELLGQSFSIFTANAVINAIVKDVKKDGKTTTIYYGDTDSQPMYIAFSAFLTEDETKEETSRNLGGEEKYINARTSAQYIKEFYQNID